MLVLSEDMAAPTIIDARPLLKLCDEVQELMDEVANWITGEESYNAELLADALCDAAMEMRDAIREATA